MTQLKITITPNQALETPVITIGKPCRYKACKGRNCKHHVGEKCPVASNVEKTGGKNGQGDSKKRHGETNGNFRIKNENMPPMREHKNPVLNLDFMVNLYSEMTLLWTQKLNQGEKLQT